MDPQRRVLVQMSGAPGSGKSTVANLLARSISAVVVNHDLIRSFFLENNNAFDESAKLAYSLQWTLTGDLLKQGLNVVIDSTCNYQETLDKGIALARDHNCDYQYVECCVKDIELLERRLRSRISMRSQRSSISSPPRDASGHRQNEDSLALFKRWIENPARPSTNAIIVDSTDKPEDCVATIIKQMGWSST